MNLMDKIMFHIRLNLMYFVLGALMLIASTEFPVLIWVAMICFAIGSIETASGVSHHEDKYNG